MPMHIASPTLVALRLITLSATLLCPMGLMAGEMERDPNGFHGIRWGADLAEVGELRLVQSSPRILEYELKADPHKVDGISLDLLRFVSIEGQFARVSIRYSGAGTHARILEYMQGQFGPIERGPGSMLRGLSQQFTWRGQDTEANLTYNSFRERGTVFIESRTLAPRFNDVLPESAY